jgi:hypothetical protein
MTKTESAAKAQDFVRSVLRDTFNQKVSEKTVRSIATKVAKATTSDEPVKKRA